MIESWVAQYIGLPYASKGEGNEFDCWTLVKHIYKKELGIILPDNDNYTHAENIETVENNMQDNIKKWVKLDKPEPFCLIIMNILNHPIHIGLCLDDQHMIHTMAGHNSAIEKHTAMKWNKRIEGMYKWQSM